MKVSKCTLFKLPFFLTALVFIFATVGTATGQPDDFRPLPPGQSIEREMSGKEIHRYTVQLIEDEFFRVRVEQKGVDVMLKLLDAGGKVLATVDSPNGRIGPEILSWIALKGGNYRLEVSGIDEKAGNGVYEIKRDPTRKATAADKKRVEVTKLKKKRADAILNEARKLASKGTSTSRRTSLLKFEEARQIYNEIGDKQNEALCFFSLAAINDRLGEMRKALRYYQLSLLTFREGGGNKVGEAMTLTNIGGVYSSLGEKQKALEFYGKALPQLKAVGDKSGEAVTLTNIGGVYSSLGEKQKALEFYGKALPQLKAVGDKRGEAYTLNSIGLVYDDLGEKQKALEFYGKALPLRKAVGDRRGEATTLNNIGSVYLSLGEKQKALEFYGKALQLFKAVGDKSGVAMTLNNIGSVASSIGEKQKALEFYGKALRLRKAVGDKSGEATTLNNIGSVYSSLGEKQKALEYYGKALPQLRAVGDRRGEGTTLHNLMHVLNRLSKNRAAIFYGKQSVNKYQELRQAIKGLEKGVQKTFLGTITSHYRKLAEILISEGRIVEAEQVLDMLKQEEVFDYLRRDSSEADKLSKRADLTPQEAAALRRYEEISDKITALGTEFGKLQGLKRKGDSLTVEQDRRYAELSAQLKDANRRFNVFLRQLADEFAKRPDTADRIKESRGLQADLRSWGKDVVFLYTLVGEERYRVILTTPKVRTDGKSEINSVDLNKKIAEFRQVVQNPRLDPRPLGKELYDILIKPIEKKLEGAEAKTLLWSLDGSLRLLPLAALWDGKQYFGQKYRNVTVTLASRTRLGDAVAPNWRALGLGVSEAKTVKEPNGTRSINFNPLPSVPDELASIVKSERSPKGVLPGQSLLNAEFTKQNLEDQLVNNYKVVHIASHFSINAGDSTRSFLLMGDGTSLTVAEIKDSEEIVFDDVELLTLSACQTAVIGKDTSGKEIEGFSYVAQQKGAKAILATLWPVADGSTAHFMSEFYRLRKNNPELTKAGAIQVAQKAFIKGQYKTVEDSVTRGGGGMNLDEEDEGKKYKRDPKAPYAHPYYWSPFVLIGNWR